MYVSRFILENLDNDFYIKKIILDMASHVWHMEAGRPCTRVSLCCRVTRLL